MIRLREKGNQLKPGDKVGSWEVLGWQFSRGQRGKAISWSFVGRCSCGAISVVRVGNLKVSRFKSCLSCAGRACHREDKYYKPRLIHGCAKRGQETKLYGVWQKIKDRCYSTSCNDFEYYGGRGIVMCDEWKSSFGAFQTWAMANGYDGTKFIDREQVNGNYEPGNCRFVTVRESNRNKRNTIRVAAFGEYKSAADWADDSRCCVQRQTILQRIRRRWNPEDAITTPPFISPPSQRVLS